MSAPTAADVDFLKQQQTFAAHVGRDRNGDFMVAGRLISDEIFSPKGGERRSVPRDSSRLLLGLTTLARLAELKSQNRSSSDPLEGIVSRPILRMLLGALGYREPDFVAHAFTSWDTGEQITRVCRPCFYEPGHRQKVT